MCAPLFNNAKTYGAIDIEVVNNMSSDLFDDNDLAIFGVTAGFVSQVLQQVKDVSLMEGDES
jgi:hypothetical protein